MNDYGSISDGVRRFAGQPLSRQAVADELDCPVESVRIASQRLGVYFTPKTKASIRQRAEEMRLPDAVEYLLGVIEEISLVQPIEDDAIAQMNISLTPCERRALIALVENPNRTMHREGLFNAIYFDAVDADDLPGLKILDVFICKLRKKLKPEHGSIETVWGVGYQFIPPAQESHNG